MKTRGKVALAALAGIALGAATAPLLHAREAPEPPGYFVAEVEVTDPVGMKKYGDKIRETLAPFHHRYIVRDGNPQALEGERPKAIVMVEFDSVAKAKEWYDSPAYHAIIPLRQRAAKSRLYVVEGLAAP